VVAEVRARDSAPLVDAFFDVARGLVPTLRPRSELITAAVTGQNDVRGLT
jgi:hypothetical protein